MLCLMSPTEKEKWLADQKALDDRAYGNIQTDIDLDPQDLPHEDDDKKEDGSKKGDADDSNGAMCDEKKNKNKTKSEEEEDTLNMT